MKHQPEDLYSKRYSVDWIYFCDVDSISLIFFFLPIHLFHVVYLSFSRDVPDSSFLFPINLSLFVYHAHVYHDQQYYTLNTSTLAEWLRPASKIQEGSQSLVRSTSGKFENAKDTHLISCDNVLGLHVMNSLVAINGSQFIWCIKDEEKENERKAIYMANRMIYGPRNK